MKILDLIPDSDSIAISDFKNKINYYQLKEQVKTKVEALSFLKPRDVVWVQCVNTIDTMINYLALWELGICIIPIDPQLGTLEIQALQDELPAQFFLRHPDFKKQEAIQTVSKQNSEILDAYLVQLSSGTTGRPKIILISNEALLYRAQCYRDELGLTPKDKTLCSVPLSHSHGIDCLALPTLFAGGELYLSDPATSFPYRILEWIQETKITYFSSLPQMYDLFNQMAKQKKYDLSSLRHAFCGSAALSENTALEFNKLYNLNLKQGYGLAEIGVICANFKADSNHYTSIGRPIPGIEWNVASDGELMVKSKALFSGYYKNFAETENRMENHFLKTEDLVSVDDQGFFYISGRKNDFINVLGQKVYPKEIEEKLGIIEGVAEYCITAQDDTQRGQIPVLHLVPTNQGQDKSQ
ncbi:MAG: long-chain fatty acid--CoA ligase, partial [Bdellovibrionales bacterium]|nr:long-chain fatty acid--CoA ligase [Bdellovibrionales bacterium]